MDKISLEQYSGFWYQIAAYPTPFTPANAFNVTAEYTLLLESLKVVNSCYVVASSGEMLRIQNEGVAISASDDNRTLIVKFDEQQPSIPNYVIEGVDPNYSFAVVTSPQKDALYLLSRYPAIELSEYIVLTERLASLGYDVSKLVLTPQLL